jgi:hypothetical protein
MSGTRFTAGMNSVAPAAERWLDRCLHCVAIASVQTAGYWSGVS